MHTPHSKVGYSFTTARGRVIYKTFSTRRPHHRLHVGAHSGAGSVALTTIAVCAKIGVEP